MCDVFAFFESSSGDRAWTIARVSLMLGATVVTVMRFEFSQIKFETRCFLAHLRLTCRLWLTPIIVNLVYLIRPDGILLAIICVDVILIWQSCRPDHTRLLLLLVVIRYHVARRAGHMVLSVSVATATLLWHHNTYLLSVDLITTLTTAFFELGLWLLSGQSVFSLRWNLDQSWWISSSQSSYYDLRRLF